MSDDCNVAEIARQAAEKLRPGFVRFVLCERQDDGSMRYCSRGAIVSAITGREIVPMLALNMKQWDCLNQVEAALGFVEGDIVYWNNHEVKDAQEIIDRFLSIA